MSIFIGKHALVDTISEIVTLVDTCMAAGIQLFEIRNAPEFCYVLTGKQADTLDRICTRQGWSRPTIKGIEIDVRYIAHVLNSRSSKDSVDAIFVAAILAAAFCEFGEIEINTSHNQQAIVINAIKKLHLDGTVYHGMAIIELKDDFNGSVKLIPITAYHATESKLRKILRKEKDNKKKK